MQGQAHLPKHRPEMGRIPAAHFLCMGEKFLDAKTIQTIESILKRGNDAKVRRKGGGYVVIEIRETIKSSPPAMVAGEGQ